MICKGKPKALKTKPWNWRVKCGVFFTKAVTGVLLQPRSFAHPTWALAILRWEWLIGAFGGKKYKNCRLDDVEWLLIYLRDARVSQNLCEYFYGTHRQQKNWSIVHFFPIWKMSDSIVTAYICGLLCLPFETEDGGKFSVTSVNFYLTIRLHIPPFIFTAVRTSNPRPCHSQAVSCWLPTAAARVRVRIGHVEFVVGKVALGQVFSEYFGFPCQSSFHQFLHHHNHPELAQ
jgi:hypothetical protein